MREQLERLDDKLNQLDIGYTAEAIYDLREVLRKVLELLDQALPVDRSDDV